MAGGGFYRRLFPQQPGVWLAIEMAAYLSFISYLLVVVRCSGSACGQRKLCAGLVCLTSTGGLALVDGGHPGALRQLAKVQERAEAIMASHPAGGPL